MSVRGKYIVLEGPEGVGKTTQILELASRLQKAGLPVRTLREPDSQSDLTARAIRQLTQDPHYPMNTRTEVLLYNAARSQSLQVIRESVEQGVICVVDRNYLTTLAIQYYGRGDVPDYETINSIIKFAVGDMEPDLCIILDAPVATLKERASHRGSGERFDNLDEAFLKRVRDGYLWEAQNRGFPIVQATETQEEIAENIWKLVAKTLGERNDSSAHATAQPASVKEIIEKRSTPVAVEKQSDQNTSVNAIQTPLITKNKNGQYAITDAGKQYLEEAVTDVSGNVYAFTEKLSPATIAAAMARLSRRGDDMRITILDEFVGKEGKDEQLLQRVITAYGDDSVQQLTGLHFVVENTTKLMTNKLEWGRLAAYLEQSTRYIYFDQKDAKGHYKFYIPPELSPSVRSQYIKAMNQIFDMYSSIVHKLTTYISDKSSTPESERDGAWKGAVRAQACDAARLILPTSTTTTIGFYASGQALESLIMHLLSDELIEAQTIGKQLLEQARKVMPMFLERADKPERGGAMVAYRANTYKKMAELTDKYTSSVHASGDNPPVTLIDFWPKNELDLVPDMLYEHTTLSLRDIHSETEKLTYEQKREIFTAYMGERLNRRHKPGRAIEKAHYSWDLVCDFGIFCDLMRHRMVDDLEWQVQTPRYGYETPQLIEDAGLSEEFDQCFDISLKLYSQMQEAGYVLQAQYATLLGHRMRWKVTYNAREAFHLHELRTSPQGHPGYRKLVQQMHEKLAEQHPMLAEAMQFVNQGEDPELTRLAAERYTQFKLSQLS